MDTYLKLTSVKNNKNCNCISPFYINGISGINPNTGREYSPEDLDVMKTALYRISAAKGCTVSACCDPNDPTSMPDKEFTKQFMQKFPKIMPMYEGSQLKSIKLSTVKDVASSGWQEPTPYFICKITKATINDTADPTIKMATGLVNDCFTDSCNSAETITVNNLLQNSKADMTYTYFDDARVSQAILEGNISYVKEYIKKYKQVNMPLTNDDYRNRMIHLAAASKNNEILTMLIALKADLNIRNKLNETPIHFAVRNKNLDNINTLLVQGVDLTIPTNKGETPMFYAMRTGDMRVINMLYSNSSPILGVDKDGNNLIHYCIMNCPSYSEYDESVPNTKSEIIQWLIEHGISTEQKNKSGITPLEMVSRYINKEIDRECTLNIKQDEDIVIEKFFGGSSNIDKHHVNNKSGKEKFSNYGAKNQNLSDYTPEHLSLLDIQTKLFNNIIRNNPDKYNKYINVGDIPKGAPIEVLDTVCVGSNNLTGNEDSDECIAKGGKLVKVVNKTTKIKLDLIPEEESEIAKVEEKDLYYNKNPSRIPKGTIPQNLSSYNASVKASGNILSTVPQTTGITYNIATGSTNMLSNDSSTIPTTPTVSTNGSTNINVPPEIPVPTTTKQITMEEHPSILDENNQIVSKCKRDAMRNSEKIQKTIPYTTNGYRNNSTSTTTSNEYIKIIENYKNPIYISIIVILAIILAVVSYIWYY